MGVGMNERTDEENPHSQSEDEKEAETRKLNVPEGEGIELKKITVRTRDAGYPEIIPAAYRPLVKTTHLKYTLLIFNFILALLGLVILILAIWIRADPEFWQYETTLNIADFYAVCHMFIVVGLVILLVGFLGCFGTMIESQWMLTAYFLVFTIIFIIEIAAVVMIWTSPFNNSLSTGLKSQIKKQIDKRVVDDSSRFFIDFIQSKLHCCGWDSQNDYSLVNDVPKSCQDQHTGMVYNDGCVVMLVKYLQSKAGLIGGIAFPILLFQIMSLVACFCLIRNIKQESGYNM